jgi:hypothetical protein
MVHSTCRAPDSIAAKLLATDSPKSSWQWALKITFSAPSQFSIKYLNRSPYSNGIE